MSRRNCVLWIDRIPEKIPVEQFIESIHTFGKIRQYSNSKPLIEKRDYFVFVEFYHSNDANELLNYLHSNSGYFTLNDTVTRLGPLVCEWSQKYAKCGLPDRSSIRVIYNDDYQQKKRKFVEKPKKEICPTCNQPWPSKDNTVILTHSEEYDSLSDIE